MSRRAASHGPPRPRGADRDRGAATPRTGRWLISRASPSSFPPSRAAAAAEPGARRRGLPPRPRLRDPARLWTQPSVRRRDPLRRGHRRAGPRGDRLRRRDRRDHGHRVPDGEPVQGLGRARRPSSHGATGSPSATPSGRRWRWPSSTARSAGRELGEDGRRRPPRTRNSCSTTPTTSRPRASSRHLKLPHYVDFQSELALLRTLRARPGRADRERLQLRLSRRADEADDPAGILKAIAIPGYQVPFGSREMPLSYGWGTGGVQVTAAIIGPEDVLKVIDQGADDTTNAVSIRKFFARTHRRAHDHAHRRGDADPDAPPDPRDAARGRGRSSYSRCRSPSRCAGSSRARPRRGRCTRSKSTA